MDKEYEVVDPPIRFYRTFEYHGLVRPWLVEPGTLLRADQQVSAFVEHAFFASRLIGDVRSTFIDLLTFRQKSKSTANMERFRPSLLVTKSSRRWTFLVVH